MRAEANFCSETECTLVAGSSQRHTDLVEKTASVSDRKTFPVSALDAVVTAAFSVHNNSSA
jgi:hypothetical protein